MWKPTNQPMSTGALGPEIPAQPEQPVRQTGEEETGGDRRRATESKRVNVIFSGPQYQLLKDLAGRQGISVSDVLRQALSLTKLIVEADENPNERILIDRNGQQQELRLVR